MLNPIDNAINWFLGLFSCLPFSIQAFIGLNVLLFVFVVIVNILSKR